MELRIERRQRGHQLNGKLLVVMLCVCAWPGFTQAGPTRAAATNTTFEAVEAHDSVAGAASARADQPSPPPDQRVAVEPPSEKALAYFHSGTWLWMVNIVWGLLVPAVFLLTGFSARIRDLATRLGRKWFFIIAVYVIAYSLIVFIVDLPLAYYQEFVRHHAYGLSDQTLAKWMHDTFTGLGVNVAIGVLFLWIPYLLLRKSPRRWWLYSGGLSVPFIVLMLFVQPMWIAPMFNDFGPMKDPDLEQQILALARRAHIDGARVYEVNKSVDTRTINAYVTGFGHSKRIVLWDTIIAKLGERQLLMVMGHEMGHYVLGHVIRGIVLLSLAIIIGLYLIHRSAGWALHRYGRRFGFNALGDIASLPLIELMFSLFFLVISPALLAYSRHQEHEADRFGLEITRDNYACASAFAILQKEDLAVPRPGWLYKIFRADHPVLGDRIDFCNDYHPWREGKPLKYGGYFDPVAAPPAGAGSPAR